MSSSIVHVAVALPDTTGNHESVGAVTSVNRDLSDRLRAVLTCLGIQAKEIAHIWGCSHVFVSLVLSGEKPLTNSRISQLPERVQVALACAWCDDLGILTGSRAAAIGALEAARVLLALDDVPLRMAKAGIDEPVKTETRRRA